MSLASMTSGCLLSSMGGGCGVLYTMFEEGKRSVGG